MRLWNLLAISWAGNQFLIDVSRSEKYHRKRFDMLKSCQNDPHTIFMQIRAALSGAL